MFYMDKKTYTKIEDHVEENNVDLGSQKSETTQKFYAEMTAGEVLRMHPEAGLVLASYHLGGCSHCGINEEHKLVDICAGYGVPLDALLDSLNSLEYDTES